MIALVRGRVAQRRPGAVVLDTGGVGYLVRVADDGAVPPRGQELALHTSLQVREDAMDLYGFATPEDRDLFELLLTASGVGPKLALAALTTHRAPVLRDAIAQGDLAVLSAVPGVGKKVAQRLVLELRDRMATELDEIDLTGPAEASVRGGPRADAAEALAGLGYGTAEIRAALAVVDRDPDADGGDAGELLRLALRALAAGAAR